jgi:HD-GYP domain-containing protein (c-di-GMP phosphodiesterase class II)
MADSEKWIEIKNSNVKYYEGVELFYKNPSGKIVLYKPEGMKFEGSSFEHKYIDNFYIKPEAKLECIKAAHKGFSIGLEKNIANNDATEIKKELVKLVDETLSQPKNSGLQITSTIVDTIVDKCSSHPNVLKNMALLSFMDYTTTVHSVNVMALTLNYCIFNQFPVKETRQMGIAALLHDLGKSELSDEIINSKNKLTDYEFTKIKKHPGTGLSILKYSGINLQAAHEGVLEHHEKLDGSGYPDGKTDISESGRLLGIIDSYEVITNDSRSYRMSLNPIEGLKVLKRDVENGKYDKHIFEKFAYSLTKKY